MRAEFLIASTLALVLPVTSCSIDVRYRDAHSRIDLPLYPDARPVTVTYAAGTNLTLSGNFSETNVVPRTFETDDTPEMVLDFYRQILGARGEVVECRGIINVHRRRGHETLICLERPSSHAVRLAGGVRGQHSVVVVTDLGTATRFSVLDVHTRG